MQFEYFTPNCIDLREDHRMSLKLNKWEDRGWAHFFLFIYFLVTLGFSGLRKGR